MESPPPQSLGLWRPLRSASGGAACRARFRRTLTSRCAVSVGRCEPRRALRSHSVCLSYLPCSPSQPPGCSELLAPSKARRRHRRLLIDGCHGVLTCCVPWGLLHHQEVVWRFPPGSRTDSPALGIWDLLRVLATLSPFGRRVARCAVGGGQARHAARSSVGNQVN